MGWLSTSEIGEIGGSEVGEIWGVVRLWRGPIPTPPFRNSFKTPPHPPGTLIVDFVCLDSSVCCGLHDVSAGQEGGIINAFTTVQTSADVPQKPLPSDRPWKGWRFRLRPVV